MFDALMDIIEAQERGLLTAPEPRRPALVKGQCPYCMKHVGKGIHLHVKACKERKQ